jgi:hypothetical protein
MSKFSSLISDYARQHEMDLRSIQKTYPTHGAWSTRSQARDGLLKDRHPKCLHDEGPLSQEHIKGNFVENQGRSFMVYLFGSRADDKAVVVGPVGTKQKRVSGRNSNLRSVLINT